MKKSKPDNGRWNTIRFAEFEFDAGSGELRKHGHRLRLQEQPQKVLIALLEKPGQVVTRDELRKRIWGDDTFVEFDHGLNAAVNRLREVLCDSAEQPRYIETAPRRGYRFIADVNGQGDSAPAKRGPARRAWWIAAPLAMAVTFAGVVTWRLSNRADLPPMRVTPLTSLTGREATPSFSPDGKQIAFVWQPAGESNTDIYVTVVGSSAPPLRLTTDPQPDFNPVWSPDGTTIAFLRLEGERSSVLLISPLGGDERKLTQVRHPPLPPVMSWSVDGNALAIAELEPEGTNGIFAHTIDGARRVRLTSNHDHVDKSPAFSPDGRFLAYAAAHALFSFDVYIQELKDGLTLKGPPRRLTHQGLSNGGVAWAADGNSIIYAGSSDAGLDPYLWRIAANGRGEPERVEVARRHAFHPAVAVGGRKLAFTQSVSDRDILKWELGGGAPAPFISSTMTEDNAQYSPDGRRIAFASSRAGAGTEIFVCSADGSNPVQLTRGIGRRNGSPRWSPDGRHLVFDGQDADGRWHIYRIAADGGRPECLSDAPSDDSVPSYSNDGRWIYFTSNRGGRWEIWRMPAEGGEVLQITSSGATVALESWDGKTFYVQNAESPLRRVTPLFAIAKDGGRETVVLDGVSSRGFVPVRGGLYYLGWTGNDRALALQFYDEASRRSRLLVRIDSQPVVGLTVSPDGRTFLFAVQAPGSSDLMMIENFR